VVRYPEHYPSGRRVSSLVSTRRAFHAILDAAGIQPDQEGADRALVDVETLTLRRALNGSAPEEKTVYAEAYTPDTLLALMENENSAAIDTYRCRSMRRAAYHGQHKLITVGDEPDELFNVIDDPGETKNLLHEHLARASELQNALTGFVREAESRRPANWESARRVSLDDEQISERLRALGYLE
jgi:uncharacterized sulfatase